MLTVPLQPIDAKVNPSALLMGIIQQNRFA
jgi:hypothetical protein